jgi:hypothetical protein
VRVKLYAALFIGILASIILIAAPLLIGVYFRNPLLTVGGWMVEYWGINYVLLIGSRSRRNVALPELEQDWGGA